MKRALYLTVILLLLSVSTAGAFRCGTRVIVVGTTKLQVLAYCGEPDSKDIQEVRTVTRYKRRGKVESTQVLEVWTYNLGPTRFMRQLYFLGNKLIRTEELEKGF
jgi:hypothetical protein